MHKLEEKGILPFGHAYKVTHHNKEVHDKVKELEEKGAEVRVAGRLTAIRGHGKTAFMDLLDKSGKIQPYVRKDELKILGRGQTHGHWGYRRRRRRSLHNPYG